MEKIEKSGPKSDKKVKSPGRWAEKSRTKSLRKSLEKKFSDLANGENQNVEMKKPFRDDEKRSGRAESSTNRKPDDGLV